MDYLKELMNYWEHGFDWTKQEKELNRFNHFKAKIEDYNIHFIQAEGQRAESNTRYFFYMDGRIHFIAFIRSFRCLLIPLLLEKDSDHIVRCDRSIHYQALDLQIV